MADAQTPSASDWRQARLARIRALTLEADPAIVEENKWKKPTKPAGTPTWSCDGIICTGETYRDKIKLTFARGASLPDPARLFNASLDAGVRRAIDLHEHDELDEAAYVTLVRAAIAANRAKTGKTGKTGARD